MMQRSKSEVFYSCKFSTNYEINIICGTRRHIFFFFSSRRRHTRLQGDWSSDVCSSDLLNAPEMGTQFLTSQMQEVAPELEFVERLANPATFADIDAERSLKVLVYRAPATPAAADTAS